IGVTEVGERIRQAGMVGLRGGDLIGEDPLATRRLQGVELEVERLLVSGNPGIANQHAVSPFGFLETHPSRTIPRNPFRGWFSRIEEPGSGVAVALSSGPSRKPSFARTPGGRPPEETPVPTGFLSDAERARLDSFPAQVVPTDIETHFTLSRADHRQIPRTASPANRLGFALQLGSLRFLGFCPNDLSTAPEVVV